MKCDVSFNLNEGAGLVPYELFCFLKKKKRGLLGMNFIVPGRLGQRSDDEKTKHES